MGLLASAATAQWSGSGETPVGAGTIPVCPAQCNNQAEATFRQCRAVQETDACSDIANSAPGCFDFAPTIQECTAAAQTQLARCLFNNCGIELGPPPCEQLCQTQGQRVFYDCRRLGGAMDECAQAGRESTRVCLRDHCDANANCGLNCTHARYRDPRADTAVICTDPLAATLVDLNRPHPIDLLEIRLGRFSPADPTGDPFVGVAADPSAFTPSGDLLRLDLVMAGLVNPPGPNGPVGFNPYRYGDHPVYGFVEIDMDDNVRTGGELDAPQYRYLGNAARFGGLSSRPPYGNHMAGDHSAFDGVFNTPPFVERHGEEFHLALLGSVPHQLFERDGNGDFTFDPGETWLLIGPFFHRAHGFELFSLADGGQIAGEYAPLCHLQFQHDLDSDTTVVSLLFPMNPQGAAQLWNQPAQPINHDPSDHASVAEALADLQNSALLLTFFPTNLPEEDIIIEWAQQDPGAHLDPRTWRVTALLGTSYPQRIPGGVYFLWTDIFPNVLPGDVDGNGFRSLDDARAILNFIAENDTHDGPPNGTVPVPGFAAGFTVFDVNHDGLVDQTDTLFFMGDGDGNRRVDLRDFAVMQRCIGQSGHYPPCASMNFNRDATVDSDDLRILTWILTGANASDDHTGD